MNGVFIIPTGVGAEIGGHAGDAVCAVNLIASLCDDLIVNPNAVNASDINEMAPNCLYVEGSFIDRFLGGEIRLRNRRRNRILLVANPPLGPDTINSVNAARVALGIDIDHMELEVPLVMRAGFDEDGSAGGTVEGWEELLQQVGDREFDCLAIQSPILVPDDVALRYLRDGGVNPWGGVEAKASRLIAQRLGKPVAHAPSEAPGSAFTTFTEVVHPRLSAEMVSISFIHCVFKGLAKAPSIEVEGPGLTASDVEFLITPDGCFGTPHELCLERGIEVIVVRENRTVLNRPFPARCTFVESYLEAAGVIACRKLGIREDSVRV